MRRLAAFAVAAGVASVLHHAAGRAIKAARAAHRSRHVIAEAVEEGVELVQVACELAAASLERAVACEQRLEVAEHDLTERLTDGTLAATRAMKAAESAIAEWRAERKAATS